MGILKEFKEFALKGNVVDLAVAVIIGGAFGAIVNSLVADVVTPLLLNPVLASAGVDDVAALKSASGVAYGKFIAAVINFIFIAIVLFILIKAANKVNKPAAAEEAPAPSSTDALLTEIRDELRRK